MASININRHRFVKGYFGMQGVTFAEIAREAGVSRQMVVAVSQGLRKSEKVEKAFINRGIPEALLRAN